MEHIILQHFPDWVPRNTTPPPQRCSRCLSSRTSSLLNTSVWGHVITCWTKSTFSAPGAVLGTGEPQMQTKHTPLPVELPFSWEGWARQDTPMQ